LLRRSGWGVDADKARAADHHIVALKQLGQGLAVGDVGGLNAQAGLRAGLADVPAMPVTVCWRPRSSVAMREPARPVMPRMATWDMDVLLESSGGA
jgi:hypothetical protein